MKLLIDINEDPARSASNQGKLFNELYWKDTIDLQIALTDEGIEPSWVGTGTMTIKLTDEENNDLTDTEVMQWADTEVRHYLELSDTRLDTYLNQEEAMPVNMIIRFDDGNFRQTLTKQTFLFYNTFIGAFTITLTLPAEPDLLEVSEEHEPNAPDQVVVAKFPKPILEIDALIIDGTEEYTPYEPSNVIALNLFVCRPPQQVEADTTPLAPDQVATDRNPLEPDQLEIDRSPLEPDQLATARSPLAPDLVTSSASPFAPQNLVVGIDDFAVSRFSPVVHMDATQEDDTLGFSTTQTATNYDFKLENSTNPTNGNDAGDELDGYWQYTGTNQYTRIRPLDYTNFDFNHYNSNLWVIEKVGSTWKIRRYDRIANTYIDNTQTIAQGGSNSMDFAEDDPTQVIPDTVPWADFTQGVITNDLRLQSATNYGDSNYALENTNNWQQPEAGYRINGNNAIYFGGTDESRNRYTITNPWNYEPLKNLSQSDLGWAGRTADITHDTSGDLPSTNYLTSAFVRYVGTATYNTNSYATNKWWKVKRFYDSAMNSETSGATWAQTYYADGSDSPSIEYDSNTQEWIYLENDSDAFDQGGFNDWGSNVEIQYHRSYNSTAEVYEHILYLVPKGYTGDPSQLNGGVHYWTTDTASTGYNNAQKRLLMGKIGTGNTKGKWVKETDVGLKPNHYDEFEIFFVLDPLQEGAGHLFLPQNTTNNDADRFLAHTPWTNNHYYYYAGDQYLLVSQSTDNPQDPVVFHCSSSRKLDKYRISVNGNSQEKTGAIYFDAGTGFPIPAIPKPQDVLIGEMIMFRNTIGVDRAKEVEGYLAHKWGINGSLPETHPWKYIKPYNADDLLGDYTYPIRPSHLVVT
jgi:hypothetical protein